MESLSCQSNKHNETGLSGDKCVSQNVGRISNQKCHHEMFWQHSPEFDKIIENSYICFYARKLVAQTAFDYKNKQCLEVT